MGSKEEVISEGLQFDMYGDVVERDKIWG
jgi:hypothetical protein